MTNDKRHAARAGWLAGLCLTLLALGLAGPLAAAEHKTVTFDFREARLSELLRVFTDTTGYNVVASPKAQDLKVSLYLEKVAPMLALETVCRNNNLWYVRDGNVIRIMPIEDYGRELVLGRDEVTRVFNLRYASCLTLGATIASVFGERVVYSTPSETASYGHVGTDEYPEIGKEPEIEEAKTAARTGARAADAKDKVVAGGLTIAQEDLARLRELAASQGSVSAEDLLKFQVGKASALLTVFPRNNAVVVCSVDRKLLNDIEELIGQLDTPTRQVLLEGRIYELSLGDGFDSFFDVSLTPGASRTKDANGNVVRDEWGLTGVDLIDAFDATAAKLPGATLRAVSVSRRMQARIEMLETTGRLKKVATPVMMCANNASARFFQGTVTPLRKGYTVKDATVSTDGDTVTPASVTTAYREEELGVKLEISPSINMDGTVTLKIVTDLSSANIGGGPEFPYVVGGSQQVGKTDTVDTTEIEGIVMAMDGQTLALGGLVTEADARDVSKIPLLGDIPGLGFLFGSRSLEKARKEIVFCITPHIIMSPDEQQEVSRRLLRDVSQNPVARGEQRNLLEYDGAADKVRPVEPEAKVYRLPRPKAAKEERRE